MFTSFKEHFQQQISIDSKRSCHIVETLVMRECSHVNNLYPIQPSMNGQKNKNQKNLMIDSKHIHYFLLNYISQAF